LPAVHHVEATLSQRRVNAGKRAALPDPWTHRDRSRPIFRGRTDEACPARFRDRPVGPLRRAVRQPSRKTSGGRAGRARFIAEADRRDPSDRPVSGMRSMRWPPSRAARHSNAANSASDEKSIEREPDGNRNRVTFSARPHGPAPLRRTTVPRTRRPLPKASNSHRGRDSVGLNLTPRFAPAVSNSTTDAHIFGRAEISACNSVLPGTVARPPHMRCMHRARIISGVRRMVALRLSASRRRHDIGRRRTASARAGRSARDLEVWKPQRSQISHQFRRSLADRLS